MNNDGRKGGSRSGTAETSKQASATSLTSDCKDTVRRVGTRFCSTSNTSDAAKTRQEERPSKIVVSEKTADSDDSLPRWRYATREKGKKRLRLSVQKKTYRIAKATRKPTARNRQMKSDTEEEGSKRFPTEEEIRYMSAADLTASMLEAMKEVEEIVTTQNLESTYKYLLIHTARSARAKIIKLAKGCTPFHSEAVLEQEELKARNRELEDRIAKLENAARTTERVNPETQVYPAPPEPTNQAVSTRTTLQEAHPSISELEELIRTLAVDHAALREEFRTIVGSQPAPTEAMQPALQSKQRTDSGTNPTSKETRRKDSTVATDGSKKVQEEKLTEKTIIGTPNENSVAKADTLADHLHETFSDNKEVKVTTKMAEVRINDDSVIPAEVATTCDRWHEKLIVDLSWASPAEARRIMGWTMTEEMEKSLIEYPYILIHVCPSGRTNPSRQPRQESQRGKPPEPRWAINKLDKDMLLAGAHVINWEGPNLTIDANDIKREANWFRKRLIEICDLAMPRVRDIHQDKIWWTPEIKAKRAVCMTARRRFQRSRRKKCRDEKNEEVLYQQYRQEATALKLAIKEAKARALEELIGIDRDPWGRPYRLLLGKLRPRASPVRELADTITLDKALDTLFS